MTDEVLNEYHGAVIKLQDQCQIILKNNRLLLQCLKVIEDKFSAGSGDNLPSDAVPFLAMGESMTLIKWHDWAYKVRWEIRGYSDENAWSEQYFLTDEAKKLSRISVDINISLNQLESISRGDWDKLFEMCWILFDSIDTVDGIYKEVIGSEMVESTSKGVE